MKPHSQKDREVFHSVGPSTLFELADDWCDPMVRGFEIKGKRKEDLQHAVRVRENYGEGFEDAPFTNQRQRDRHP